MEGASASVREGDQIQGSYEVLQGEGASEPREGDRSLGWRWGHTELGGAGAIGAKRLVSFSTSLAMAFYRSRVKLLFLFHGLVGKIHL